MKLLITSILSLLLTGCSIFGYRSVEEPKYQVLKSDGNFEVRKYNKMIIAKTYVNGDYDDSTKAAFRKIADFIFGENTESKKISMTAPVVQENQGQKIAMTAPVVQNKSKEGWYMYFIMPSKYTLETLPKPKSKDVIIEEVQPQTIAVYTYSGFTKEDKLMNYRSKLSNWVSSIGFKPDSTDVRLARYNHPLTLPPFRTNEVHIKLED